MYSHFYLIKEIESMFLILPEYFFFFVHKYPFPPHRCRVWTLSPPLSTTTTIYSPPPLLTPAGSSSSSPFSLPSSSSCPPPSSPPPPPTHSCFGFPDLKHAHKPRQTCRVGARDQTEVLNYNLSEQILDFIIGMYKGEGKKSIFM